MFFVCVISLYFVKEEISSSLTATDKIYFSCFPMIFSGWLRDFPVLFSRYSPWVLKCISPFLPGVFMISQPGPVSPVSRNPRNLRAPAPLSPWLHPRVPGLGSLGHRPRLARPQPWEASLVWPQIISVRPRRNYHRVRWHVSTDICSDCDQ